MDDIKRRSQNSRSRLVHQPPLLRAHQRDLYRKVEEFESDEYAKQDDVEIERNDIRSYYNERREDTRKPFRISRFSIFSILGLLTLVSLVLLFTFVFNRATIKVTPRVYAFSVDADMDSGALGYFASSTETVKKTLERSEKKKVQAKASGQITIYNNYTEDSQKLVKNTRFEAAGGIIFRISESVIVPGKKNNTPGSMIAKVTADSFGENYNIKPSKFTIPGFKNSPRYDGFYAESATAMSGGIDGERYIVSNEAIALADTGMQNTLKASLSKAMLNDVVKDGYVYATNTMYIKYTNNLDDYAAGKAEEYTVTGSVYMLAVNKRVLADKIAKASMSNYNSNTGYSLQDAATVTVSPKSDLEKDKTVHVNGKGVLVYDVNYQKIKESLVGKAEDQYSGVLSGFSSVEKADISITPFWIHTFPQDIDKLKTVELLP